MKGARVSRFFAFTTGRRGKWVVLALWLVVAVGIAPFAGKLESVEKNESSSFLPGNAESTKVLAVTTKFQGGDIASAVVIYRRTSGLTQADVARVRSDYCAIVAQKLPGVLPPPPGGCSPGSAQTGASPKAGGQQQQSQWVPPTLSPDQKAMIYGIPINSAGGTQEASQHLIDDVDAIRKKVGEGSGGLDVKVTGGAGFSADAVKIFNNIDSKLLYSTLLIVAILLLITYRSPVLWLIPLITVAFAEQCSRAIAYALAQAGVVINGETAGVLVVLVFGAGTDYALLIVARYREELRRHEDRHEAMAFAMRRSSPAIMASGLTVIAGLLCLLAASLNSNRGLGPVSAVGIAVGLVAMLTLLPAILVITGRWVFWPFVPHYGSPLKEESGLWARIGHAISPRPRLVWIVVSVALGAMALGLFRIDTNLTQLEGFRGTVDSVEGQKLLALSFPQGATAPTDVVVTPAANASQAAEVAQTVPGVVQVAPPVVHGNTALLEVILKPDPYSQQAFDAIDTLRQKVKAAAGPGALVGGQSAIQLDAKRSATRDFQLIVPMILLVVLLILAGLLRAILAPVLLILTVILSYLAALGASILVFKYVFGFGGIDPGVPLLVFVFLVALGVDYNIFLMARVREESLTLGTREGMLKGLAVTGGVITSAGIVLAGTFSVLGVLPLVVLTEIGFTVAFGVLLDTLIVRSILVPALTLDVGKRMWWPSALAHSVGDESPRSGGEPEALAVAGEGG
jgi:RND superfamily putative drug exporter